MIDSTFSFLKNFQLFARGMTSAVLSTLACIHFVSPCGPIIFWTCVMICFPPLEIRRTTAQLSPLAINKKKRRIEGERKKKKEKRAP
jgi:hypothetical protein